MTVLITNASNLSLGHGLHAIYGQNARGADDSANNLLLGMAAINSRDRKERNHERHQLGGAV